MLGEQVPASGTIQVIQAHNVGVILGGPHAIGAINAVKTTPHLSERGFCYMAKEQKQTTFIS